MILKNVYNKFNKRGEDMPVQGDDDKQGKGGEEFWKPLENQEKIKENGGIKGMLKNLPTTTIILVLLIVIVGAVVVSMALKVSTLKAEISEIKGLKTQITAIEAKLGEINKDRDRIKNDLTQVRGDLETFKAQKAQAEAALQKQITARKRAAAQKSVPRDKRP